MKRINEKEEMNEILSVDKERKEEVKRELQCCYSLLKEEHEKLYDYQVNYFCWVNSRKDIINSMKSASLDCNHLDGIMSFSDTRNTFLVEKLKMLHSSISYIKRTISNFDSINDFVEIDSIDTVLRLILTSLGLGVPTSVFGEPF